MNGDTDEPAGDEPVVSHPVVDGASLFEQMMAQAVQPFVIELGDDEWEIEAPDPDGVAALDEAAPAAEHLHGLLGDIADDVFDVLDTLPRSATVDLLVALRQHFNLPAAVDGDWVELIDHIDCYGDAVEGDLMDRGFVLADWFRGRYPWPMLLRQIPQLPPGSRYWAAVLEDEDLARERIRDRSERTKRADGSLLGETPDRALDREILNTLRQIRWAIVAVKQPRGKQGRPPSSIKGPRTAEDRLRERETLDKAKVLANAITNGRDGHQFG